MKIILKIFVGLISLFIIVLLIVQFTFKDTVWGGWTPPDTSLKLNAGELKWVEKFQNDSGGTIDFIGLNDDFTEDSIIYIDLNCHHQAIFENMNIKDKFAFTKAQCKAYYFDTDNRRTQNYIQFSYLHLKEKNDKHAQTLSFLYDKTLDSIMKIN
jgi:hypothetical protein